MKSLLLLFHTNHHLKRKKRSIYSIEFDITKPETFNNCDPIEKSRKEGLFVEGQYPRLSAAAHIACRKMGISKSIKDIAATSNKTVMNNSPTYSSTTQK
jgi:hypothetical protein